MTIEKTIGYIVFLSIAFAVALFTIPVIFAESDAGYTEIVISKNIFLPKCEKDDSCLSPSYSVIEVNSSLNFTNTDIAVHNLSSGSPRNPTLDWSTGMILSQDYSLVKFEHTGEFPYYCPLHPWILGHVKVIDTFGNEIIIPEQLEYDYRLRDVIEFPMDFQAQEDSQNFVYLLQIKNSDGVTIQLTYLHGVFRDGQDLANHPLYSMSFMPIEKGTYTVEKYLWADWNSPISIDENKVSTFTAG